MENKLLAVNGLKTYFSSDGAIVKAVDDISFSVNRGETIGIVGESGSGKSVTALSIMQLVPGPHGKIESGSIEFYGRQQREAVKLLDLSEEDMQAFRGK